MEFRVCVGFSLGLGGSQNRGAFRGMFRAWGF